MAHEHCCKTCDTTDPSLFYRGASKSECKNCVCERKKRERTSTRKPRQIVTETVTMKQIEELIDRIDSLDEEEVYDRADGKQTFRERLNESMQMYDNKIETLEKSMVTAIESLVLMKEKYTELESKHARLESKCKILEANSLKALEEVNVVKVNAAGRDELAVLGKKVSQIDIRIHQWTNEYSRYAKALFARNEGTGVLKTPTYDRV